MKDSSSHSYCQVEIVIVALLSPRSKSVVPSAFEHVNTRGGRKSTDFTLLTQDVTALLADESGVRPRSDV